MALHPLADAAPLSAEAPFPNKVSDIGSKQNRCMCCERLMLSRTSMGMMPTHCIGPMMPAGIKKGIVGRSDRPLTKQRRLRLLSQGLCEF